MSMRALVVDDSGLFRRVVTDALSRIDGVEVVGAAVNGSQALQRVAELKPDLITLDIEMPEMDGLQVLEALRAAQNDASVIVLSGLTSRASVLTVKALERGAFDFITKPGAGTLDQNKRLVFEALQPRVMALARRREIQAILRQPSALVAKAPSLPAAPPATALRPSAPVAAPAVAKPALPALRPAPPVAVRTAPSVTSRNFAASLMKPEMVLIGVSTGGPNALAQVLPEIPRDLGVPILIVQHMPPIFTASLAESLAAKCAIRVMEAKASQALQPNTAYIAPGGRHMRVAGGAAGKSLQITDDPPENNCRPAVDYLFRSAAQSFPGRAMAVILTGMGSDGAQGLRLLKRHNCHVIAQDEASCVVYGMPRAAVEAGVVDSVLPLDQIAGRIVSQVRRGL